MRKHKAIMTKGLFTIHWWFKHSQAFFNHRSKRHLEEINKVAFCLEELSGLCLKSEQQHGKHHGGN